MATVKQVVTKFAKDFGEGVVTAGDEVLDTERCPFGIFPLDVAVGGGFPLGRVTIVYGPESSAKTNICLRAIREYQRRHPKRPCFFFDLENSFDPKWSERMGVDTRELRVIKPAYGEQFADQLDALLYAEDCGLVVVDSLAAVVSANEIENTAERVQVGGSALLVNKIVKRATVALSAAEREREEGDHAPPVIFVNQVRQKIGVMFGDPEVVPGGMGQKFASALTIRVWARNKKQDKSATAMPSRKHITALVKKWKVPITFVQAEFDMIMVPQKGMGVGMTDDWDTASTFMEDYGLITDHGKGKDRWEMLNKRYRTIAQMRKAWVNGDTDPSPDEVRAAIITDKLREATQGDGPSASIDDK